MKRACFADTEAEASALAEVLRDHGIDVQLVPIGGPYPSLAFGRWGEVRVQDDKLDEATRLVEAWRAAGDAASIPEPPPPPKHNGASHAPFQQAPARGLLPWVLLALSLILNALLLMRAAE